MRSAPGAPSAHAGAVGAAGVVSLGMARECLGGALGGCQRAVGRGDCRLGDSVEPRGHHIGAVAVRRIRGWGE
jgi:hypothetical protein